VVSLDVVSFEEVYKYFRDTTGKIITAVDGVKLKIKEDEIMALVGESGSGKTTLGRISVGLIQPSKGRVLFNGKEISDYTKKELWKRAQYIHQDPYSSLDPYLTVGDVLDRPLKYLLGIDDEKTRREIVQSFLQRAGMEHIPLTTRINRLSGGERQRVLVGRAFIIKPKFVAADEPTSMVDFVHRNEILNMLFNLKKESNSSIMFITHDLSIASYISNRIAIMHKGRIVEFGSKNQVVDTPFHPYTQALFSVTPEKLLKGSVAVSSKLVPRVFGLEQSRCKYADVCPFVFERCRKETPVLRDVGDGHSVACFKY
jgi:peptide/nickel transport system ATP-binding protein